MYATQNPNSTRNHHACSLQTRQPPKTMPTATYGSEPRPTQQYLSQPLHSFGTSIDIHNQELPGPPDRHQVSMLRPVQYLRRTLPPFFGFELCARVLKPRTAPLIQLRSCPAAMHCSFCHTPPTPERLWRSDEPSRWPSSRLCARCTARKGGRRGGTGAGRPSNSSGPCAARVDGSSVCSRATP